MSGKAFAATNRIGARAPVRAAVVLLRSPAWSYASYGFVLGVLVWTAALRLGVDAIPDFRSPHIVLLAGVLGGMLALSRARALFGLASGLVCVALLVVMYTPLAPAAIRGVIRQDPLRPADAVVVLAAEVHENGTLTDRSLARLYHAYELLRQGAAPRLVVTPRVPPDPSCVPAVRRQLARLRFDYPVDEAGPVENTHDAAVAVSLLAAERRWSRVILVSHPAHMRRAAATFEKAGVPVICSPCPEARYDLTDLYRPDDRLAAFRDWLHEAIGYLVYRLRGWV